MARGIVVAAGVRVDLRGPAELAGDEDRGRLEQALRGRAALNRPERALSRSGSKRGLEPLEVLLVGVPAADLETVTNRTPDSTSRVASRQLCAIGLSSNSLVISGDSLLMSNASRERGELMMS